MRILISKSIFWLITGISTSLFSGIIYVNDDSPCSTTCDGTSWGNAYKDLQLALAAATTGDTIWLAEGRYHPHVSDPAVSFSITEGIKIYGGFSGSETLLSQRNYVNYVSVLSGDLFENDDNSNVDTSDVNRQENSRHIVEFYTAVSNQTILDGVYIYNGNAYSYLSSASYPAGGVEIYNVNADPVIRNCTFKFNISTFGGGALESYGRGLIENCVFQENVTQASSNGGGAVKCVSGMATEFRNCIFEFNKAVGNGAGGAVLIQNNAQPEFINCRFSNNTTVGATTEGGAVYIVSSNNGAHGAFTNCIFNNNSAAAGGAVNMWGSVADFYNCTFYNNNSGVLYVSNGGGISQSPKVYNSILWGNTGLENNNATYKPEYYSCLLQSTTCQGALCNCCLFNMDPSFVDPSTNNFRFQSSGSPAANVGMEDYVTELKDYYGFDRVYFVVDMGAAESVLTGNAEISLVDSLGDGEVFDDSLTLNFTSGEIGDTITKIIQIRNSGSTTLMLCDFNITGNFSFTAPPVYSLTPLDYITTFTIRAHASASGVSTGQLTILNNDIDEEFFEVNLQQIIETSNGEVIIYPGVSPNLDGKNDYLRIDNIEEYPANELFIYDRIGNLIASYKGYDNTSNSWKGEFRNGNNERVVNGTYYYVLKLDSDSRPKKGFLVLQD